MRVWFLTVGLIIITAGAVMAISYSLPKAVFADPERVAYVSNSMILTANLTQGDNITLRITQGFDWPTGIFDVGDGDYANLALLYVAVNITDPRGKNTTFLTLWTPSPQSSATNPPLVYIDINVTTNDGGVDPMGGGYNYRPSSNSFLFVGGIANFDGKYAFQVWGIFPGRKDPPSSLDLWKRPQQMITTYPLTFLLPLGFVVVSAGIALAAYSIMSRSKTRLQKTRTKNKR